MPFHLGDETAISYHDSYMILRVAYRIQLERGIRVNRIGSQTDPHRKLIRDSKPYSEQQLKSMEISWRNASCSAQPLKNKTLMLSTEGGCDGAGWPQGRPQGAFCRRRAGIAQG